MLSQHTLLNCTAVPKFHQDECQIRDKYYASQFKCGVTCNAEEDCLDIEDCFCDGKCGFSCLPSNFSPWKRVFIIPSNIFAVLPEEIYEILPVCSTLPYPENGNLEIKLPASTEFGLHAIFNCTDGYVLVGAQEVSCMSTGNWSDPVPKCVRVEDSVGCDKSLMLAFREYRFAEEDVVGIAEIQSTVEFTCHEGYHLIGSKSHVTCQADGTWSQVDNSCWRISCGSPNIPDHAFTDGFDFSYGTIVTIDCEPGFKMLPDEFITFCQADGSWSDQRTHVCQAVSCPEIEIMSPTLKMMGQYSTTYNTEITFQCTMGYHLIGVSTLTCLADGTWTDPLPKCQKITCNEPETGYGVTLEVGSDSYSFGDVIKFACIDDTMLMIGSETRQCTVDGLWSGGQTVTSCVRTCDPLPQPDNLGRTIISAVRNHGFILRMEYRCRPNFTLVGRGLITCDITVGKWDSTDVPNCIQDSFGTSAYEVKTRPVSIINGILTVNQWESVTMDCLIPASESWKGETRWYRPGKDARQSQYSIGRSRLWYRINLPRIQLEDEGEYRCGLFEVHQVEPSLYSKVTIQVLPKCSDPRWKVEGHVDIESNVYFSPGESVMFVCKFGYRLNGNLIQICLEDGTWSGQSPQCNKVCLGDVLPDPKNGYSNCVYAGDYTATQKYYCYYGYKFLNPDENIVSCIDGIWNGEPPKCVPVSCPALTPPNFGDVSYVQHDGAISNHYTVGSTVSFTCDHNYVMHGSDKCSCQHSGQWDCDTPLCLPATNIAIKYGSRNINNGDIIQVYQGRDVFLDCKLISNHISGLSLGDLHWNRVNNRGQRVSGGFEQYLFFEENCLRLGILSISTFDEAKYQCGTDTAASQVTIQVLRECPELVLPQNGVIFGMTIKVGTVARYQCDERYRLHGPPERVCQQDGTWTGSTPTCDVYSCGEITFPENGYYNGSYNHEGLVGEYLEFACELGYSLLGPNILHCQDNGTWNKEPPQCQSKCISKNCDEGQYCQLSGADPVCLCLSTSDCTTDGGPVCGQDAITYASQCHLAVKECETNTVIGKAHNGICKRAGLCQLDPITRHGTCNAVYFWDEKEHKCKHVQDDECLPGEYGFTSFEECYRNCSNACAKPHQRGPCKGNQERWAYDVSADTCVQFLYSGCGGNENNFKTRDECMIACPGTSSCKSCDSTMDLVTACRVAPYAIKAKVEGIREYATGTQFNITIQRVLQGHACETQCWITSTLEYHLNRCQCPQIRQLDASYLMVITQFNNAMPVIDKGTYVRVWDDKLETFLKLNPDCQRFDVSGNAAFSCTPDTPSNYCQLLSMRTIFCL
ncbi:sushi, von Willebrand factor type A, EGF and pentraxin domain-containing protein 1-like isoform X2 [Ptychodera flava]|uniref:sushi, von Willebrand factor type A, EGF and pentraxin domain-containing protein 1-like isoform X2 n=1 Tax=Ptychodera flava TaxID=63121 RepID=UPI00396A712B